MSRSSISRKGSMSSVASFTSPLTDKYTNLVQISNQPVVVLDIGRAVSKVGFSGEDAPRALLRTPKDLFSSRQKTAKFLRNMYKHDLKTSPQAHKLVVLEDITADRENLERLVQSLFVDLRVPVICVVPSLAMVPYSTGCNFENILVVDIGHEETKIVPVLTNHAIIQKAIQFSEVGTLFLTEQIMEDNDELTRAQAEDVLTRACFVSKDKKPGLDVQYRLSGCELVTVEGKNRQLYRSIFQGEGSLSEKIIRAIEKCPMDAKLQLCENIVVVGGGSNITGLKLALHETLNRYPTKEYGLLEPQCNGNIAAWVGASLFAQVKYNLDKISLLRDAYVKFAYTEDRDSGAELSNDEMLKITSDVHLNNDNFLPREQVLPDLFRDPTEVNNLDELCLTLAQVMEAKRRPMKGSYMPTSMSLKSSASTTGMLSSKDYLDRLRAQRAANSDPRRATTTSTPVKSSSNPEQAQRTTAQRHQDLLARIQSRRNTPRNNAK